MATPKLAGPGAGAGPAVGLAISLVLHALVFIAAFTHLAAPTDEPDPAAREPTVTVLTIRPLEPDDSTRAPTPTPPRAEAPAALAPPIPVQAAVTSLAEPVAPRPAASMAAPPAPTAQEWAFASTYTLKNSKGYRYTWGQQVRSMMGTAVEGPEQGMVRFRVEIAPDGSLARLETLWSTSPVAERLARQAIGSLPQWPPTPTGRPLIFERTISFTPFASDDPPLYRDDCLPDPPAFSNPFAWDGRSAREPAPARPIDQPDPQDLADCIKQLPKDSIEAESANDRRLMERWGWGSSRLER